MSSDPQEKIAKRTIKNITYPKFLENTKNSEDPLNMDEKSQNS